MIYGKLKNMVKKKAAKRLAVVLITAGLTGLGLSQGAGEIVSTAVVDLFYAE